MGRGPIAGVQFSAVGNLRHKTSEANQTRKEGLRERLWGLSSFLDVLDFTNPNKRKMSGFLLVSLLSKPEKDALKTARPGTQSSTSSPL